MKKVLFFICGLFVTSSVYGLDLSGSASDSVISIDLNNGNFIKLTDNSIIYGTNSSPTVELYGAEDSDADYINLNSRTLSITQGPSSNTLTTLLLSNTELKDSINSGTLKAITATLDKSKLLLNLGTILDVGNIILSNASTARFLFENTDSSLVGWDGSGKTLAINSGSTFNHGSGGNTNLTEDNIEINTDAGNFNAGDLTITGESSLGFTNTSEVNVDNINLTDTSFELENSRLTTSGINLTNSYLGFKSGSVVNVGEINLTDSSFTLTDSSLSSGDITLNNSSATMNGNTGGAILNLTFQGTSTYSGDDLTVSGAITIDPTGSAVGNNEVDGDGVAINEIDLSGDLVAGSFLQTNSTNDVDFVVKAQDIEIDTLSLTGNGSDATIYSFDADTNIILGVGANTVINNANVSFNSVTFTSSKDFFIGNNSVVSITANSSVDGIDMNSLTNILGDLTLDTADIVIDTFITSSNNSMNLTFDNLTSNILNWSDSTIDLTAKAVDEEMEITTTGTSSINGSTVNVNNDLVWNNTQSLNLIVADFNLNDKTMTVEGDVEIRTNSNATTFDDGELNFESNLDFNNEDSGVIASLSLTDIIANVGGDITLGVNAELSNENGSFNGENITMGGGSMISTVENDFIANDIIMNDGVAGSGTRVAIETIGGSFSANNITIGDSADSTTNDFAVIDFWGTDVTIGAIILNANATTTADLIFKNDNAITISSFNTNGETLTLATDSLTINKASWSNSTVNLEDYNGDTTGQITFTNPSATDFVDTQFNVNKEMELIASNFNFSGTDFTITNTNINEDELTITSNVYITNKVEINSTLSNKGDVNITGEVIVENGLNNEFSIKNINFTAGSFENRVEFTVEDSIVASTTIDNKGTIVLSGTNELTEIINTDGSVQVNTGTTTVDNIIFTEETKGRSLRINAGSKLIVKNLTNSGILNYYAKDLGSLRIQKGEGNEFSNLGTMNITSNRLGIEKHYIEVLKNSGTINVITESNAFTLSGHETIANAGVLSIEGKTGPAFTFTNNGNITGGTIILDGKGTTNTFNNYESVEVDTLTITKGDFNNNLTGLVNAGQVIIDNGDFTNSGELHGTVNVISDTGKIVESKTGNQTVNYNVNLNDGEYEIDNSGTLTFNGNLSIAENADLILVDTEFLLEGKMTIDEDKTGFALSKINNQGTIIAGDSANAFSVTGGTFKNNGTITGKRAIEITSSGIWKQSGNVFSTDLAIENSGVFNFADTASEIIIKNSFTNSGTITGADDALLSLDGGTWTETKNLLELKKVKVSNGGAFEVGVDTTLDAILEVNNGTLNLNDNDLQITKNLIMNNSTILMQRTGVEDISVIGNANLENVSFNFDGSTVQLTSGNDITLVSAGSLTQSNVSILNWGDILANDTIGILEQDGNDLNLKAVDEMNYEDIVEFSENNNNMAEAMTELQNLERTTEQNQLLMYFATIAYNGTEEETRKALEAIRSQNIDASLKTSAFINSSILNQITGHLEANSRFARINSDYKLPKDSVWFDVSYISSATDKVADFNEYNTKGGVASFGREIKIDDNIFTGGVATFGTTTTEGETEDGEESYEVITQTMALSGYLQYVSKYGSFYGTIGGSMQAHELERTTFLENKAKADYTMTNYFAKFSGEISILKNIIPSVFVSQQHLGAINYTEKGADGENLIVKGEETDLTQAGASLRLQIQFNKTDLKIVPYLKVETKTLIAGDEGVKFQNSFVAGGTQFENTANAFDDSSTIISAGLDVFENSSATKTTFLLQMEQSENSSNYQVGLQMNLMF